MIFHAVESRPYLIIFADVFESSAVSARLETKMIPEEDEGMKDECTARARDAARWKRTRGEV